MALSYLLRRLLLAIPTLAGVAVIVFVLLRVVPGDPIAMMIPPGATEADIENLRRLYGLDLPIWRQFLIWAGDVLQGRFGTSISMRQAVLPLILSRLPATLELAVAALLAAVLLGGALAVLAVAFRGVVEALVDLVTGVLLAIPDFLWGLIFILVLGVFLPVLPISGRIDPRLSFEFVTQFYLAESVIRGELGLFAMLLSHLVLPAAALALPLMAVVARILKNSLKEAMAQDYVAVGRTRGFGRARLILRHALPNALIPALTLSGVQFTFLIGGTVLIERLYSYPGIGSMAIGAVIDRDLPMIQGLVLTFAVLFIAVNLAIDLSYALLNPRLRHG